jgi:hypothetical protein
LSPTLKNDVYCIRGINNLEIIDKDATLLERVWAMSAILTAVFVLFSFPGLYADYLPSQEYLKKAQYPAFVIVLIIPGLLFIAKYKSPARNPFFNPLNAIAICVILAATSYCSIMISFPFLMHQVVSKKNDTESYLVDYRNSEYHRSSIRKCQGGVHIRYEVFLKNQVCGISRDFWEKVNPGDIVELAGTKTYFGFDYSNVRLKVARDAD